MYSSTVLSLQSLHRAQCCRRVKKEYNRIAMDRDSRELCTMMRTNNNITNATKRCTEIMEKLFRDLHIQRRREVHGQLHPVVVVFLGSFTCGPVYPIESSKINQ